MERQESHVIACVYQKFGFRKGTALDTSSRAWRFTQKTDRLRVVVPQAIGTILLSIWCDVPGVVDRSALAIWNSVPSFSDRRTTSDWYAGDLRLGTIRTNTQFAPPWANSVTMFLPTCEKDTIGRKDNKYSICLTVKLTVWVNRF